MVADCLEHGSSVRLPSRVAVGVELVNELVIGSVQHDDVARKTPEPLFNGRLVLIAGPILVMTLQVVGHMASRFSKDLSTLCTYSVIK